MNTEIDFIINDYMRANPHKVIPHEIVIDILAFAKLGGYIQIPEMVHPHTFGGITVSLTDSQLAEIIHLINENKKITAIKLVRQAGNHNLRDAKSFVDHLVNILIKI